MLFKNSIFVNFMTPAFLHVVQGMDAESYSLHTFEALLTQSMENIGKTLMRYSNSYTVYALIKVMNMIWQHQR